MLADVTRGFGPAPEPNETMARSWSELGLFIYFMLHPSCHGASDMVPPCPEAKHCFEQALKFAPGDPYFSGNLKQVSPSRKPA